MLSYNDPESGSASINALVIAKAERTKVLFGYIVPWCRNRW